jgi:hypothetical protein
LLTNVSKYKLTSLIFLKNGESSEIDNDGFIVNKLTTVSNISFVDSCENKVSSS